MAKERPVSTKLRLIYKLVHTGSPVMLLKYHFKTDYMPVIDEPYIVYSNHLTELDTLMLVRAFPKHMYFVAGEHFTRTTIGKVMKWSGDPIFEFKGSSAISTVREIVKRVRSGCNVHVFAEGCRSFNGETLELPESAAKLVQSAKCGLVTYRFEGAYFVAPRWAKHNRVGPIRGLIVNHYSAAEVASMSRKELLDCINRDLHENAYERQRREMHKYTGEKLAAGLENYLIRCSGCGAMDSMVTSGDEFRCVCCGQKGKYNEYGFLEGDGLRFDSVYDWGVWSEKLTEDEIKAAPDGEPVYTDDRLTLDEITAEHERVTLAKGSLRAYKDRLEFIPSAASEGAGPSAGAAQSVAAGSSAGAASSGSVVPVRSGTMVFDYKRIPPMEMMFGRTLLFSHGGRHYEISGNNFRALKYTILHSAASRG